MCHRNAYPDTNETYFLPLTIFGSCGYFFWICSLVAYKIPKQSLILLIFYKIYILYRFLSLGFGSDVGQATYLDKQQNFPCDNLLFKRYIYIYMIQCFDPVGANICPTVWNSKMDLLPDVNPKAERLASNKQIDGQTDGETDRRT